MHPTRLIREYWKPAALSLAITVAYWPARDISMEQIDSATPEMGIIQNSAGSKGSHSLLLNGKALSCSGGIFFASHKCPYVPMPNNAPSIHCTAFFAYPRSLIGMRQKILVYAECPPNQVLQLNKSGLAWYRQHMADAMLKYLIPFVLLVIVLGTAITRSFRPKQIA